MKFWWTCVWENVVIPNNRNIELGSEVHEIHHASRNKAYLTFVNNPQLRQFSKDINETNKYNDLTNDVRSHLIEPYFPWEGDAMLPLAAAKKTNYSQIEEMGASAAEGRFRFWKEYKDKYGKIPTVDELNKFIDEASESAPEFFRYKLPKFNDYMNDFGGIYNSKNPHEAYEKELAEYRKLRDSWKRKPKLKWRVKNPKPEMSPFLSNYKHSEVKLEHQKQLYEYWKNAMKNISGYALPIAGGAALVAVQRGQDEQPSMRIGGILKRK